MPYIFDDVAQTTVPVEGPVLQFAILRMPLNWNLLSARLEFNFLCFLHVSIWIEGVSWSPLG